MMAASGPDGIDRCVAGACVGVDSGVCIEGCPFVDSGETAAVFSMAAVAGA